MLPRLLNKLLGEFPDRGEPSGARVVSLFLGRAGDGRCAFGSGVGRVAHVADNAREDIRCQADGLPT